MTTLPQTTPPRLPGSNGYGAIVRGGGHGLLSAAPAGAAGMSGADVWRVIRANLWLIIISVIIAGGVGYGANWYLARYYPSYTATGLLGVIPPRPVQLLPDTTVQQFASGQMMETNQQTQVQLMLQPALYAEALTNSDTLRQTEWFKQFASVNDARKSLMDDFSVAAVPQTNLIRVSMSARQPRDARIIVEAVVDQYLRDQQEMLRDQTLDRTKQLNNLRNQYKIQLDDKTAEMRQKALALNLNGAGVPGRMSTKEIELAALVRTELDLQMQAADAQGLLESTQQQVQQNRTPQQVEMLIDRDPQIMNYQQTLVNIELRLQEASAKYGADFETVKSIERQKAFFQQKLNDRRAELVATNSAQLIEMLRSQAAAAQDKLQQISGKIDVIKKDMGEISNQMAAYLVLMDQQKNYSDLLKQVDDQLDAVRNTTDQPIATAQWRARPDLPDQMSFPRLPIVMGLAVVLGLGLSVGIAFLRELMDTSVRSPRDVARVGQLTLLGMIPDEADDPHAAGVNLSLVIAEAPHSLLAEQYRQIRTRLQHAASLDTTRTILITSGSPGDGKSTVACNLAAGLALNGRKILLVDADFRRPSLHQIFGLDNEHGFSEALPHLNQFDSVVRQTQVPNLFVLPCGPKPQNATEQLESRLFTDFIERALDEYDHVIFDSGALLFASETLALAPRVDGVITVVRARSNSRGLLQRLRDGLKQVRAEHLGVVLNAVRSQGGGYYARNIKTYYSYHDKR